MLCLCDFISWCGILSESLLSLRKSALLKQLDDADHITGNDDSVVSAGSSEAGISNSTIDDEYAAFQVCITIVYPGFEEDGRYCFGSVRPSFHPSVSSIFLCTFLSKCASQPLQTW